MDREEAGSSKSEAASDSHVQTQLADDMFYRALAAARRRRLLALLIDETPTTVDEIATVLAGWDATDSGTMATPDDRTKIRIRLIHSDLPVMVEAGLVTHDSDSGTVRINDLDPFVAGLLQRIVDAESRTDQ